MDPALTFSYRPEAVRTEYVVEAVRQMSGMHHLVPSGAFWDGRIVPGFGSATQTSIDIGALKDAIVRAIEALADVHDKLSVAG